MMEQVHMQIQEGCDDKMGHYVHYIGGGRRQRDNKYS